MSRLHIYCEGQTEETFVRDVLAPHLLSLNIYATASVASTKRVKFGSKFKGGIVSYPKAKRELQNLLKGGFTAVTTMIDVYGLPADFPGQDTRPGHAPYQVVAHLEREFANDLSQARFIPYLSLHEFEALLFVAPEITISVIEPEATAIAQHLITIRESVASPEEIDEGPETAPSKRILGVLPAYGKPLHGPLITSRIGLAAIRAACPHFAGWLTKLESLG